MKLNGADGEGGNGWKAAFARYAEEVERGVNHLIFKKIDGMDAQ